MFPDFFAMGTLDCALDVATSAWSRNKPPANSSFWQVLVPLPRFVQCGLPFGVLQG